MPPRRQEVTICDPGTLLIAGTALASAGSIVNGVNQSNQARYQARVADANAKMDQAAAQDAIKRGAIDEQRQYRRNAQVQGAQRAALSANGIEADFGSAGDIQTDAKLIGWEDAQTIRENAQREAKGFQISAANQLDKAASSRAAGTAAIIGGVFDAGSTILGGAQRYSKYKAGQGTGA